MNTWENFQSCPINLSVPRGGLESFIDTNKTCSSLRPAGVAFNVTMQPKSDSRTADHGLFYSWVLTLTFSSKICTMTHSSFWRFGRGLVWEIWNLVQLA